MVTSVLASVIAYISTNIDDIFVLMIFLTQTRGAAKGRLIAGHFIGVGMITAISMLGALGLQRLPGQYIGLLGIVPVLLGIRACFKRSEEEEHVSVMPGILGMALITLGNSADNLGVYIPLFTSYSHIQRIAATTVFLLMTAAWVWLANALSALPRVKTVITKYKAILIPIILIGLGIFIIIDSGLIG